jgi:hypothetical protein
MLPARAPTLRSATPTASSRGRNGSWSTPLEEDVDPTQLRRASRRWTFMTLDDLEFLPAPGRYPFQLTDRLAVVVPEPVPEVVIVVVFFDGQLLRMTE